MRLVETYLDYDIRAVDGRDGVAGYDVYPVGMTLLGARVGNGFPTIDAAKFKVDKIVSGAGRQHRPRQ